MTYVFHRSLNSTLPTVVGGEGSYLIDDTGKRYLDACGGAAVSCLGHSNATVQASVTAQLEKLAFAHTSFFTNEPAEELAEFIVKRAPKGTGNGRVMFLGSGSEAMEAALKLARQYHLERGDAARSKAIALKPSYHGNTLGALAVGGHEGRRKPFAPMLMQADHIDAPYAYRLQQDGETETTFAQRMASLLEERIRELGPETVAAFVAEPVIGASLGTQPAPTGYFKRIREICDKYGVLLIADEVMCGMGRTGTLFASEQEGICADISTMAKGLGAGYQPIAAVLARETVVSAIAENSGKLWNGHTYMSHAVASAGALAVMKVIHEQDLLANVRARGTQLGAALHTRLGQNRHVGNIRGRGLFWSVELVKDRETKAPFDATTQLAFNVQAAALEAGLMCYPSQGCADGTNGDHILLAPCYNADADEIDLIVSLIGDAIDAALQEVS